MTAVIIVAIVFGGLVLALAVVGGTILMAIKLKHSGLSRKSQQHQSEEAMMIQEIFHGLDRLEKRVDALETILIDGRGKDTKNDQTI